MGAGAMFPHSVVRNAADHIGEQAANFCPDAGSARVPGPEHVFLCSGEYFNFLYTEESGWPGRF